MRDFGESSGAQVLRWLPGVVRPPADELRSESLQEFREIYEQCLPVVLRYMLARVHDPAVAEDLAGDVFEQAVRSWPTFEHRSAPSTWILGIAHHVVSHYRRQSSAHTLPLDAVSVGQPHGTTLEDEVQRRDEAERLWRVIARLPARDQELLALRYVADLSFREIAAVVGTREVTVRVRMHRAMGRLSHLLQGIED